MKEIDHSEIADDLKDHKYERPTRIKDRMFKSLTN